MRMRITGRPCSRWAHRTDLNPFMVYGTERVSFYEPSVIFHKLWRSSSQQPSCFEVSAQQTDDEDSGGEDEQRKCQYRLTGNRVFLQNQQGYAIAQAQTRNTDRHHHGQNYGGMNLSHGHERNTQVQEDCNRQIGANPNQMRGERQGEDEALGAHGYPARLTNRLPDRCKPVAADLLQPHGRPIRTGRDSEHQNG